MNSPLPAAGALADCPAGTMGMMRGTGLATRGVVPFELLDEAGERLAAV